MAIKKVKKPLSWNKLNNADKSFVRKQFAAFRTAVKGLKPETLPAKIRFYLPETKTNLQNEITKLQTSLLEAQKTQASLKIQLAQAEHTFKKEAGKFAAKAQKQVNIFKDTQAQKVQSEMENVRRYALTDLLKRLSKPFLTIKHAVAVGKKQDIPTLNDYLTGFEMLLQQMEQELSAVGITCIHPQKGDAFDHNRHTTVKVVPHNVMKDIVVETHQVGYMLHGRVLVPAKVSVYVQTTTKKSNKHNPKGQKE